MNVPTLPKPELHLLTIEEVTEVTKECIKETVGEYEEYSPEIYTEKTKELTANILQALTEASSISKYIINIVIIQNNGCGVHANTGAHWTDRDFFVTVPFSNDAIHVIASISSVHIIPTPDELITNLDE